MSLKNSDSEVEKFNEDNSCCDWTNPSKTSVCVSSVVFALVGAASLVLLAAWSFTTSMTSEMQKSDTSKAYTNKNDVRYFKNDINDYRIPITNYVSELKPNSDSSRMNIAVLPANTFVGPTSPPAIPVVNSAEKPYIVLAQPNDLNLDLVEETPHSLNADPIISDGKPIESNSFSDIKNFKLSHSLGATNKQMAKNKISPLNYGRDKSGDHRLNVIKVPTENFLGRKENYKEALLPMFEDSSNEESITLDMNSMNPSMLSTEPQLVNKIHPMNVHGSSDAEELPPMNLYRIHNAIKIGAVCLDGSVPAYYHRPGFGTSERLWIIHFNGGAWCFDPKACFERSHSSLGSTKKLPTSPPIIQGINSADPAINPDFHDWNLVWVVYCDGASFTGNRDRPLISENGDTIYMRGKRVLNAIVNDLLYSRNLDEAEALILTGSSAGSMTAIFQADYIASKLPKTIPVRVFSDAGFFIDTSHIGGKNLNEVFKAIYRMQNSSSGLNQDCVNDVGLENGWKCFFPALAVRYMRTPVFVLNSLYDIWALMYFIGINCKFPSLRQQERKKRSLYTSFVKPKASEPQMPYPNDYILEKFEYDKRKRDISGFEIIPYFRTSTHQADYSLKDHIPNSETSGSTFSRPNGSRYLEKNVGNKDSISLTSIQSVKRKRNASTNSSKKETESPSSIKLGKQKQNISTNSSNREDKSLILVQSQAHKTNLSMNLSNIENMSLSSIPTAKEKRNTSSTSSDHSGIRQKSTGDSHLSELIEKLKTLTSNKTFNYLSHDIMSSSFRKSLLTVKQLRQVSEIDTSNVSQSAQNRGVIYTNDLKTLDGILSDKKDRLKQNKTNQDIVQHIRLKLLDFLMHHRSHNRSENNNNMVIESMKRFSTKNKTRRSASIAKEYISILRSDPPECTEKELLTAMLYRNEIIRATDNVRSNRKSARFLISCINHSSSLFDETWATLKVGGKTIQQAFGDWFFDRDEKSDYDFVDCPYPCNLSCP